MISGSEGVSHNVIYRGKNLGTISNLNEYIAFRTAHGIDDKSYKDLYLGDYFKIQDGTYNKLWMVAHFDYYNKKGDTAMGKGVTLISREFVTILPLTSSGTPATAYKGTVAYTTNCPAIASALSTVLGSYLASIRSLITNTFSANVPSMAGGNKTGASTGWEWVSSQCILPTEVQIIGHAIQSSSSFEQGEGDLKLAIFNFINPCYNARDIIWLRSLKCNGEAVLYNSSGFIAAGDMAASHCYYPLIYIN